MAWCQQDSDLLLSCGKDNRILCWNPNAAAAGQEFVSELASSTQWIFDVLWCPRNPAVIASASFDGHVSAYSLMGGQQQVSSVPTSPAELVTKAVANHYMAILAKLATLLEVS